ncbi:hypothetical protein EB796_013921 [Bugula neritina]|uniref:Uncharacterized protein n=1 Tax=Bugula neritina TaxID=10212 RepID=A0A7J7JN43_BUGNE|nr:hypothetical protein EB796_013921 [Bugula neritina]
MASNRNERVSSSSEDESLEEAHVSVQVSECESDDYIDNDVTCAAAEVFDEGGCMSVDRADARLRQQQLSVVLIFFFHALVDMIFAIFQYSSTLFNKLKLILLGGQLALTLVSMYQQLQRGLYFLKLLILKLMNIILSTNSVGHRSRRR